MFKSKILVGLITGAMTLASLGTITMVYNPDSTSKWIAKAMTNSSEQNSGKDSVLGAFVKLIDSTIPVENGDSRQDGDNDESDEIESSQDKVYISDDDAGEVDALASATADDEVQTAGQAMNSPGTVDGSISGSVDAIASASYPAGTSTSSGSGTGTSSQSASSGSSVDVMASASQPGSSSSSLASQKGLKTLDEAKAIALNEVANATYVGYEFEDEYPPVYEIVVVAGSIRYEIEIHAVTGAVLEIESESISNDDDHEVDDEDDDDNEEDDDDEEEDDDHDDESDD